MEPPSRMYSGFLPFGFSAGRVGSGLRAGDNWGGEATGLGVSVLEEDADRLLELVTEMDEERAGWLALKDFWDGREDRSVGRDVVSVMELPLEDLDERRTGIAGCVSEDEVAGSGGGAGKVGVGSGWCIEDAKDV
jgi:hypothetical protein